MVSQANHRFFFFDAVGTLLKPNPDVITVYHRHGQAHRSLLTCEEIQQRFSRLYPLHFPRNPLEQEALRTSEQLERVRWQALVTELFDDVADPERLFESLWGHFSRPDHWELYPDAVSALQWLDECRIPWGIASNFDRRLEAIVSAKPELASARLVITSARAGWSKPAAGFFQYAGESAAKQLGMALPQFWMIGDSLPLDVAAARASSWKAVWLQREHPSALETWQIRSLPELQLLTPSLI